MALSEVKTEKVYGRIKEVHIGYDNTHGVNIQQGTLSFEYWRIHECTRANKANTKASATILQPHSSYGWRLRFISDCRVAFFATDVGVAGGNQYAMNDDGDSCEIEYFRVIMPVVNSAGAEKTRTYIIHQGYATKNRAYIGDDQDAVYEYEGDAKSITYSDA